MSIYRYFERPHQFSTYRMEPRACDLCGLQRPGYDAGGFSDLDVVCEECLAGGRLAEDNVATNEGDRKRLGEQVRQMRTELTEAEVDEYMEARTHGLEQRTPQLPSWQPFCWPVHCGDYCRYVKEVGQGDLNGLAPDGDGLAFFIAHDVTGLGGTAEVWSTIRPDAPDDNALGYHVGVYLFRCLSCGDYVILWDCD